MAVENGVTLVCPYCGCTDIQVGGFTGRYAWCKTKGCYYFDTKEDSYEAMIKGGNMALTKKLQ